MCIMGNFTHLNKLRYKGALPWFQAVFQGSSNWSFFSQNIFDSEWRYLDKRPATRLQGFFFPPSNSGAVSSTSSSALEAALSPVFACGGELLNGAVP
jgi:hypothetical protein